MKTAEIGKAEHHSEILQQRKGVKEKEGKEE
jgi:hypothetical protein